MRILFSLAIVAALVGCQQSKTRLDKVTRTEPVKPAEAPGAGSAGAKIDRSGTVEQQLARLQDAYDRNAEAMEFLGAVYAQQKAQQAAQEREQPADDAVFAVSVADAVKAGQVEGPAGAAVTIVEAWDFA